MSSTSGIQRPSEQYNWNIRSTATKWLGRIAIALAIIAVAGVAMTFAMKGVNIHALGSIGSDVMIFGGGAAGLSGVGWLASKAIDYYNKRQAQRDFDNPLLGNDARVRAETSVADALDNDLISAKYAQPILMNGKTYYLTTPDSAEGKATISNHK